MPIGLGDGVILCVHSDRGTGEKKINKIDPSAVQFIDVYQCS